MVDVVPSFMGNTGREYLNVGVPVVTTSAICDKAQRSAPSN